MSKQFLEIYLTIRDFWQCCSKFFHFRKKIRFDIHSKFDLIQSSAIRMGRYFCALHVFKINAETAICTKFLTFEIVEYCVGLRSLSERTY